MRLSPRSLVLVAALGSSCAQIIGLDDYEKVPDGGKGGNSTAGNSSEAGEGPETGGSMSTRGGKAGTSGGKAGSSGGKAGTIGGETGSAGEDPGTSGGTSNRGGNGNTTGGTLTLEGGSGGTGGAAGDDGNGGTITGSGGTTSKGGTTGAGGSTSKGGTTGAGGTTSKGGTTGAGGSTSKGGTTGCGANQELLGDPSFDDADGSWYEAADSNGFRIIDDPSKPASSPFYASTDPNAAWLGGLGDDDAPIESSVIWQVFSLPARARTLDLECSVWIDSLDTATDEPDFLQVNLEDLDDNVVEPFGYLSNLDRSSGYFSWGQTIDVAGLGGQDYQLAIYGIQNSARYTDFIVDDCTLRVLTCQ